MPNKLNPMMTLRWLVQRQMVLQKHVDERPTVDKQLKEVVNLLSHYDQYEILDVEDHIRNQPKRVRKPRNQTQQQDVTSTKKPAATDATPAKPVGIPPGWTPPEGPQRRPTVETWSKEQRDAWVRSERQRMEIPLHAKGVVHSWTAEDPDVLHVWWPDDPRHYVYGEPIMRLKG